ncbi:transmembrane protein, putative [Medicago truncatula]|uniref:Transmembrane protein, putative n=1 Tax=Medicago truncatula TaxID=3880 RepID=G7IN15_MEDTR|nr:transmembrane protein, putative [Medicago truncatula]
MTLASSTLQIRKHEYFEDLNIVIFTKWQSHYKLIHTSGGTWVRTPVMTSGLTISAFCQLIILCFFVT